MKTVEIKCNRSSSTAGEKAGGGCGLVNMVTCSVMYTVLSSLMHSAGVSRIGRTSHAHTQTDVYLMQNASHP